MKNQHVFDRAVALLNELVDVYLGVEKIPFRSSERRTTRKDRRLYRRMADRLRRGEQKPVFEALYTPEQLATLIETIVRHDDKRDETLEGSSRILPEIWALMREDAEAVREAFDAVFLGALRLAEEHGPDSEEAARWRTLQSIARACNVVTEDSRRQKKPPPQPDPLRRIPLVPAEVLEDVPEGAEIIRIPAGDDDPERERMFIRIGLGPSSWIGSFACGEKPVSTMFIMPNGKHFFVSACGAGYIVDLETRTLVERAGTAVVGVHRDELMTIFMIDHNGMSLEAFGVVSRLWKTGPLGAGGLRNIALRDDCVIGEAWQASGEWLAFDVNVATGAVTSALRSSD
jgi:hypothetical protein